MPPARLIEHRYYPIENGSFSVRIVHEKTAKGQSLLNTHSVPSFHTFGTNHLLQRFFELHNNVGHLPHHPLPLKAPSVCHFHLLDTLLENEVPGEHRHKSVYPHLVDTLPTVEPDDLVPLDSETYPLVPLP